MTVFNIAREFSAYPGGRYRKDGPHSGEELRERLITLLNRARQSKDQLVVELDGTVGYSASFLEEAFGGLVREGGFDRQELGRILSIQAKAPVYAPYKALAEKYIAESRATVAA